MSKNPVYNDVQSVFALNYFSNLASSKKGTPAQLTKLLSDALNTLFSSPRMQRAIGNWQVVWGPVVGSYDKDVQNQVSSNALYVAKNTDTGKYVIATAGTNPISWYGWVVEDFDVIDMVAWNPPSGIAENAMVSKGTATGLGHLLAMQDSKGQTLEAFLTTTFSSVTNQTQLVVSGHSLGGALSAVLALYIFERQATWNPAMTVIVSAEPSAGATPGNAAFSNYYTSCLGGRTLRFWNKLDAVPHAWQPDMIESIPFLYYPYFVPNVLLQAAVAYALGHSVIGTAKNPAGGSYKQLMLQSPPLPGQVNLDLIKSISAYAVFQLLVDMELKKILAKLGVPQKYIPLIIEVINYMLKSLDKDITLDELFDYILQGFESAAKHAANEANATPETAIAELQKANGIINNIVKLIEFVVGIIYKALKAEFNLAMILIFMKQIITLLKQVEGLIIFLMQMGYQHTTSYGLLLDMAQLEDIAPAILKDAADNKKIDKSMATAWEEITEPTQVLSATNAAEIGQLLENILTPDFLKRVSAGA